MTVIISTLLVLLFAGFLMEGTANPLKWPRKALIMHAIMLGAVASSVFLPSTPL